MSASHWITVKPLKDYWRQECHKFYCKSPGTVISKRNFNLVFRDAWLDAIILVIVVSGFRKTGVYPFNHHGISCTSIPAAQGTPDMMIQHQVRVGAVTI